jgi:hypothetical protein
VSKKAPAHEKAHFLKLSTSPERERERERVGAFYVSFDTPNFSI